MIYKIIFLCGILYFSYNTVIAQDYARANSFFNEGTDLYQEGRFEEAIESYNSAETIYLKLSKEKDLSAYTSLWRGIAYNSLFDYESAIIDLKKSIKKAIKQNLPDVMLSAYSYLADSYYSVDNWSDAYNTYESALKYTKKLNKIEYFPAIYDGLGNIEFAWGKYDAAEEFYSLAMEYAEKQNMQENIIKISIGFGRIEHDLSSYSEALLLTEKYSREGDRSICLYNIGLAYVYLNKLEEAIPFFENSINIKEKLRLSAIGKDRLDYLASEVHVYQ